MIASTMPTARDALTPDALALLQTVAQAAASPPRRASSAWCPSAVTYRVRQIEDALDVLLFDRSSRQARLTAAGAELLREGGRLLGEIDAVANRVKRVATGWESQLTIAVDTVISRSTDDGAGAAPSTPLAPATRLRLRDEALSGTLRGAESRPGRPGASASRWSPATRSASRAAPLGELAFVYAVAPHHPLAAAPEPLERRRAAAASRHRGGRLGRSAAPASRWACSPARTCSRCRPCAPSSMRSCAASGGGFVPEPMARPYIESGRLVVEGRSSAAPRLARLQLCLAHARRRPGRALQWWLGAAGKRRPTRARAASSSTRRPDLRQTRQRLPMPQ